MRITLIYPKVNSYDQRYLLGFGVSGYVENVGKYPPLSLAYVAAIIKKAGHDVNIIDSNILNLELRDIIKKIKEFSPDLLGFTVTTPTFYSVCHWIHSIKEIIDIPVMVGGALLELYPNEIMQCKEIDYAIIGMGVNSLPRFLESFKDKRNLYTVPGLCFREGEKNIINKKEALDDNINLLPFPARDLLQNNRYRSPFTKGDNFTTLVTSRGCVFKCFYCCLPGTLQMRSIENTVEEMEECYYKFSIRNVDIYDSIFTADKSRVVDICQRMRKKRLNFSWTARTHINLIDFELLQEMSASGCSMLMYGIESVNPNILKELGRESVSIDKIKTTIALTKKARISTFGYFILGSPGETVYTIEENIRTSKELGLDFVQFSGLAAIPGTALYKRYLIEHGNDYWRNFILKDNHEDELYLVGNSLKRSDVMRCVKKGNLSFYLRPFQIIKILLSVKTLRQLINYIKAGLNMLFFAR